jgi:hypothetical protein
VKNILYFFNKGTIKRSGQIIYSCSFKQLIVDWSIFFTFSVFEVYSSVLDIVFFQAINKDMSGQFQEPGSLGFVSATLFIRL